MVDVIRPDQINLLLLRFAGPIFALLEKKKLINTHAQYQPLTKYYGTVKGQDGWKLMASVCLSDRDSYLLSLNF